MNDLVRQIAPGRAQPFTDVRQAAEHLAAVLADGPRRLVILDDVWFKDQLAAFPVAGRCARLVTTRVQSLVAGATVPVKVDQMSDEQARHVLTAGLSPTPPAATVEALLMEAGRWPLLLRLLNKILIDKCRSHADIHAVTGELLQHLRRDGAARVDDLTGATGRQLWLRRRGPSGLGELRFDDAAQMARPAGVFFDPPPAEQRCHGRKYPKCGHQVRSHLQRLPTVQDRYSARQNAFGLLPPGLPRPLGFACSSRPPFWLAGRSVRAWNPGRVLEPSGRTG